jgi:MFS family permease
VETSLRPLTLGEILDRTAQLYRSKFVLFVGIFAIYAGVVLVLNLLQIGVLYGLHSVHGSAWLAVLTAVAVVIKVLLVFACAGAAVAAISRAVAWLHLGEKATIRGAYKSILPRLVRYLWLMTITFVMAWFPVGLLYGGFIALVLVYFPKGSMVHTGGSSQASVMMFGIATLVFGLLLLPAIAYGIVMMLRYALAVPACVVENLKTRAAIRRSIELSKGARARIFVLGLLVFVIELGLIGLTQVFFLVSAFKQHGHLGVGAQALSQIAAFFTNTVLGPIYATGLTLFYYDQRVRKEGYDIEWMMQAAGLSAPAESVRSEPAHVESPEPPQAGEPA